MMNFVRSCGILGVFALAMTVSTVSADMTGNEEGHMGGWVVQLAPESGAPVARYLETEEWNPLGIQCEGGNPYVSMGDGPAPEVGAEGDIIHYRIDIDDVKHEIEGEIGLLNRLNMLHGFTAPIAPESSFLESLLSGQRARVHHGPNEVTEVPLDAAEEPIRSVIADCTDR